MSTQKTAWLIVACCLLLFASEGLAQEELPDPPRWYVNREIDPITDKKRVFTSLRGRIVDTMTRDGAITGVPTLSISCNTRGTWFVRSPQGDLYKNFHLDVYIPSPVLRPEFDPANPNRPPMDLLMEMVDRDVIVRLTARNQKLSVGGGVTSLAGETPCPSMLIKRNTNRMRFSNDWPRVRTTNWPCARWTTT